MGPLNDENKLDVTKRTTKTVQKTIQITKNER